MPYSVPTLWEHGDYPTAANMNKYSDGITAIYDALDSGKKHVVSARFRQYETRTSDTHNALTETDDSYFFTTRHWRWLFYKGEGTITNLAGTSTASLPDTTEGGVNVYDLASVPWMTVGMLYKITGVKWAFEDWEP